MPEIQNAHPDVDPADLLRRLAPHQFESDSDAPAVGRQSNDQQGGRLVSGLRNRLPPSLHGAVVDPALRGVLALAGVALIAAMLAVFVAWRASPDPVTVPTAPAGAADVPGRVAGPAASSSAQPVAAAPSSGSGLIVDVAGKVRHPGVVSLPAGARVADAIAQAGGVLPGTDTSALSQARRLVDGEQVLVTGKPGSAAPAAAPAGAGATAPSADGSSNGSATGSAVPPGGPVDLNTATVDQLDALPGVGPVLAGRILEWRTQHGSFTSVDQLREVKGLGGKKGEELKALVRV